MTNHLGRVDEVLCKLLRVNADISQVSVLMLIPSFYTWSSFVIYLKTILTFCRRRSSSLFFSLSYSLQTSASIVTVVSPVYTFLEAPTFMLYLLLPKYLFFSSLIHCSFAPQLDFDFSPSCSINSVSPLGLSISPALYWYSFISGVVSRSARRGVFLFRTRGLPLAHLLLYKAQIHPAL